MDEIKEFLEDKLNEECGVFGIYNSSSSSSLIYYGLHALQHRGQEGCGIVVSNGNELKRIKGEGLVQDVFNNEKISSLQGIHGIGHIRYSTAGGGGIENVQPFFFRHHRGDFALAHNGNIVNSKELKTMLENRGSIFQSTSDSEILAHLIRKDGSQTRIETIIDACRMIEGGFAFVLLTKDKLYAFRDKHGLRPLSIGLIGENTYVVSSETCAFEVIGAKFIRDLEPGEIVTISSKGIESTRYSEYKRHCMCAMEYIYFARPDSDIEGVNVHA
ncbi:MAG: amidophosphoribosyltransferase, partial [Bacilli bacterium]